MQKLLKKYGVTGAPRLHSVDLTDAKTLATILVKEHPQTAALTIAHCNSRKAGEILKLLPMTMQIEVVNRIAKLDTVDPEKLAEIDDALQAALKNMPPPGAKKFGGPEAVAKLLTSMEPNLQKQLIEELEERDPDLAEDVVSRLVAFEDIVRLDARDVQKLIPRFPIRDWAIALKSVDQRVIEFLLSNMSERAAATLKDEITSLPLMRVSEVIALQKKIIEEFKGMLPEK